MPSFKSLEMAAAVSAYHNISIRKSFFSTKVIYIPTDSAVKTMVLEYSPSDGKQVERLLCMPPDEMIADIEHNGKPRTGANGNFRLDICLSKDRRFCALQLFRFVGLRYCPVFAPRFYEGKDAETVSKLF